ncbi:uncharacterized protein LOC120091932 [Benincasa hispida]|uniref:uncharacterized protein LOC120091932 n=1 Tax=Benincasa hispida TaxID=102211 RepID=UPI0019017D31|nr:uncharacterized protein LOC120091932 [Benincasa hispida]
MAEQPISVMTVNSSSSSSETELPNLPLQINDDKSNNNVKVDDSFITKKKKKKKSINILKVALMLLRRRSGKSKNPAVDVASKGMWNRLIGAMRPLHLQRDDQSPPIQVVPSLPTTEPAPPLLHPSPSVDSFEDVNSSSSSVDGMSSRYASAINLHELDQNDQDDENENSGKVYANMKGEDEMIDVKAEMFIAQFYVQMRLQRSDSDICYNEMIKKSID